ncbi:MAG: phosphoribosylformylglycinamidine synthase I [Candidatus Eremiobacteraeota bacterium]|nr:phosphoribosylformylglycinamidine synthase I [Candidatus Eremiobacteraeota bacterium]MBC5803437.1 phosphoribosylformylglycinamidine synthase I [Candidatus Eremiobacteraeota bacterium]MBC5823056.1 phosphoribosylformylglycinamidine synthase I [Candidatus Eremiobacteraeota bacterium]
MSARVGIVVFPGTNSEEETLRACLAVGLEAALVPWNAHPDGLRSLDAFVLPGGFAYEDRVRAGAIAAHDRLMSAVRAAAAAGKPVLGICNGAQVLVESGLVPALDDVERPQVGFTRNAPAGKYRSTHVHVKLAIAPERCTLTASLPPGAVLPAWASHGEGRLAGEPDVLARVQREGRIAFVYCDAHGAVSAQSVPNGSALGAAALVNARGNVLALMPHPERDAWTYMHHGRERERARGDAAQMLATSGGIALFAGLARAVSA